MATREDQEAVMNSTRNPIFAVVAIALWTGTPAFYLLALACPLMMLFMMQSMSPRMGHNSRHASTTDEASGERQVLRALDCIPPRGIMGP